MSYDPETYWPERYDRQGPAYVAPGGREELVDPQTVAILPYFSHLPSEGRVLDFGCGPERFRGPLEAHGLEYEGVDLVPELGTMEVDDVEPGSFDAAVAIFVLQHIVDDEEYPDAVGRIWRALRYGGRLLVVDHQPREDVEWDEHMNPRGWSAVDQWGWSGSKRVAEYDGHWIGVFTK